MHHVLVTKQPYIELKPKPEHRLTTEELERLVKQSQKNGFIQLTGIKQIKDLLGKSASLSSKHARKTYAKATV